MFRLKDGICLVHQNCQCSLVFNNHDDDDDGRWNVVNVMIFDLCSIRNDQNELFKYSTM